MSATEAVDVHEELEDETLDLMERDLDAIQADRQKTQRSIEVIELDLMFSTSQLETDVQNKRIEELRSQSEGYQEDLRQFVDRTISILRVALGVLMHRMEKLDLYTYNREDTIMLLQATRMVFVAGRRLEWIAADQKHASL